MSPPTYYPEIVYLYVLLDMELVLNLIWLVYAQSY